jgi:hypothetical protein
MMEDAQDKKWEEMMIKLDEMYMIIPQIEIEIQEHQQTTADLTKQSEETHTLLIDKLNRQLYLLNTLQDSMLARKKTQNSGLVNFDNKLPIGDIDCAPIIASANLLTETSVNHQLSASDHKNCVSHNGCGNGSVSASSSYSYDNEKSGAPLSCHHGSSSGADDNISSKRKRAETEENPVSQFTPNYSENQEEETDELFDSVEASVKLLENLRDSVPVRGGSKYCQHVGCKKRSNFNDEGKQGGRFCVSHKLPGMVDVKNKHCEQDGCNKTPSFNIEGEHGGRFCAAHKHTGMISVKHKPCEYEGCGKHPTCNASGTTRSRFCAAHKLPGMVDVYNKHCEHVGCNKSPNFNHSDARGGRFCASHKHQGMIDVNSKRCEHMGCNTHPSFNNEGESRGRFCVAHKLPSMVNVRA